MPDRKCPHCGLWSTESAQVCDCGYSFVTESISAKAEYISILQEDGRKISDIPVLNRKLFFRIFACLVLFYLIGLPSLRIPMQTQYFGCLSSIVVLTIVISIKVSQKDKYLGHVLRKMWKYLFLGIFGGGIIGYATIYVVGSFIADISLSQQAIVLTTAFVVGLVGLYIGKKRVLDRIEYSVRE